MTDTRAIAADASYLILFVGFAGAMVALSIALMLWSMYDSFGTVHAYAAAFNILGWIALPFMPGLFRSFSGRAFSLSRNAVIA